MAFKLESMRSTTLKINVCYKITIKFEEGYEIVSSFVFEETPQAALCKFMTTQLGFVSKEEQRNIESIKIKRFI